MRPRLDTTTRHRPAHLHQCASIAGLWPFLPHSGGSRARGPLDLSVYPVFDFYRLVVSQHSVVVPRVLLASTSSVSRTQVLYATPFQPPCLPYWFFYMDIIHCPLAYVDCLARFLPLCPFCISLAPNLACVRTFGTENGDVVSLDMCSVLNMMSVGMSGGIGLPGLESCLSVGKLHDAIVLLVFLSPCAWCCMHCPCYVWCCIISFCTCFSCLATRRST